ncbi:unnamed protein product, partial [Citrullus colocynthis]
LNGTGFKFSQGNLTSIGRATPNPPSEMSTYRASFFENDSTRKKKNRDVARSSHPRSNIDIQDLTHD